MKAQTRWAVEQMQRFLQEGNAAAVIEIGEHVIAHEDTDLDTYLLTAFCLGLAHEQQGAWERALHWYRECLAADPSNPASLAGRGRVFLKMGRTAEAAAIFDVLARRHPDRADYQHAAGSALIHLGRLNEATERLQRAHDLAPSDPHILNDLATAHLLAGDLENALLRFRQAIHHLTPDRQQLVRSIRESIEEVRAAMALHRRTTGAPGACVIDVRPEAVGEPSPPALAAPAASGGAEAAGIEPAASGEAEAADPVRARVLESMSARQCRPRQILAALHLWSDFLEAPAPGEWPASEAEAPRWTAAVVYAIGRLDGESWAGQEAVAEAFRVAPGALARAFARLRTTLALEIGDPRYASAPSPRRQLLMEQIRAQRIGPERLLL